MKLDFRIDWGYQYLYSRRLYHPRFIWDGTLSVDKGTILHTYSLDYPVIWYGPGQCAKETELSGPSWQSCTKRGISGIRIEAEAEEDAVFILNTASASVSFTVKELGEKGRLCFPVGPKYLGCRILVTKTGFLWFRQPLLEGEIAIDGKDLGLPVHDWARMTLGWLSPGETVSWDIEMPKKTHDREELLVGLTAMAAKEYTPEKETVTSGYLPMELFCDGRLVKSFRRYYRFHDDFMQILEDEWQRIEVPEGKHVLSLKNCHEENCLALSRIKMKVCTRDHGELSVPSWMLLSEKITGKVYAVKEDVITVSFEEKRLELSCRPGWNEFVLSFSEPGICEVRTFRDEKTVEVIDVPEENPPVKVGYDMTVVPHDENSFMDWLLDYTERTRLGNYVVFRNFLEGETDSEQQGGVIDILGTVNKPVAVSLLRKWGEYCRTHNIWVSACTDFQNGVMIEAAGEKFHDCGLHEYPGRVYAFDPAEPYASCDMKEASEHYMAFLKKEIDETGKVSPTVAFGDASGGIRYSYLAGVDFVRAETMVGHTQVLLSQARPAAEALGNGNWGVHIAIQHNFQPYHETHLGQYFLSLMQPWMMGAEVIYEEDSLFCLFKEERQAWDDLCTKGKRDMTRGFYRFAKTHPRRGKNVRRIAFLEGRYAAPFNGFICDCEQDPHYSVWGLFGNKSPEWGHGQPEKCRAILDVLMPGASTHPFLQKFDKRRFFFSGTPYGDFDCIPCEADGSYWNGYRLLLNLGWNTLIEEDYEKMKQYVENGGTLVTGIPQFSTHTGREFLSDMADLALYQNGDLSGLCGIFVHRKGEKWCGQWNSACREELQEPELSSMPSESAEEDDEGFLAEIELMGAEIVAWDSSTGKPLLVRNSYGKGFVYTFTFWAYPGHEKFQRFAACWVQKLAGESLGNIYVKDKTGEVFWTVWEDMDDVTVMMLNTDWTQKGNKKKVELFTQNGNTSIEIPEGKACFAKIRNHTVQMEYHEIG